MRKQNKWVLRRRGPWTHQGSSSQLCKYSSCANVASLYSGGENQIPCVPWVRYPASPIPAIQDSAVTRAKMLTQTWGLASNCPPLPQNLSTPRDRQGSLESGHFSWSLIGTQRTLWHVQRHIKNKIVWGWNDGSVQSAHCSSRVPEFGSQDTWSSSYPPVTLATWGSEASDIWGHLDSHAYIHIHTHIHIILKIKQNLFCIKKVPQSAVFGTNEFNNINVLL